MNANMTNRSTLTSLFATLVIAGVGACSESRCGTSTTPASTSPESPPKTEEKPLTAAAAGTVNAHDASQQAAALGRLSFFTSKEGRCHWMVAALPSGVRSDMASFAAGCSSGDVAIAPDGNQALVTLDTERLYLVKLATHEVIPLASPKPGALGGEGFTPEGVVVALTLQSAENTDRVTYAGKTYRAVKGQDGILALAHSFTLADGGTWTHREVKATTTGWDYAEGVGGLKLAPAAGDLSPSAGVPQGGEAGPDILKQLNALKTPPEDSSWVAIATDPPSYYVQSSGEFAIATPTVAFTRGAAFVLGEEPLTIDQAWIEVSARYLLVAAAGDRGQPRVYDLHGGALVFKADDVVGAGFMRSR